MAVNGEIKCPPTAVLSVNDSEENEVIGLDLLSNGDTNSTRPASAAGSHSQRAPSTTQSMSTVSLEERLKRMRAAEELKQQQRYAAFIESQRQADLVRMRAQEERKRKIEELRQREEARRALVLERRRGLEQSNKARIELLRERSRAREESVQHPRRRVTEPSMGSGRTASASPSLGSARNPNQLMTTSCVVAFGSSAPRSICTQPNTTALRLQKAFEARLASYLTGRHSGCFLTSSAAPHYARLIEDIDPAARTASALTYSLNRQARAKHAGDTLSMRRAISAHAPFIPHTRVSLARSTHVASTKERAQNAGTGGDKASSSSSASSSYDTQKQSRERSGDKGQLRWLEPPHKPDEVSSRSNSSQDCNKLGRPPRVPSGSVSSQPETKKSSKPNSVSSCNSSTVGSVRSISVDTLSRPAETTHVATSVFDRLTANTKSRAKVTQAANEVTKTTTKTRPAPLQTKKPTTAADESRTSPRSASGLQPGSASGKQIPKGMSQSVYVDHTDRKRTLETKSSATTSKRSASPPPTISTQNSLPAQTELPQPVAEPVPSEPEPVTAEPVVEPELSNPVLQEPTESPSKSESSVPSVAYTGPIKAETHGSGEGAVLNENEAAIYRAKLVEQRRLAKERKEEEQRRLEEENRQRRLQQEAARLAAEQAAREQAEIAAREAAESQRQREEEEKARLEAAEAERLMKLQRAEEERILRKKKLDSIMSRVKQTHGVTSSTASSPALQTQQQDERNAVSSVHVDASDSQLYDHTANCTTNGVDTMTAHSANSLNPNADISDDDRERSGVTDTMPRDATADALLNKPESVFFSLCAEADDASVVNAAPELDASGDHTSSSLHRSETDTVQTKSLTPSGSTHDALHDKKSWSARQSSESGSPEHDRTATPVTNQFQLNGDLPTVTLVPEPTETLNGGVSTVSAATAEAPRFKSALLQSMLGGGRLATRAKDAVAGLRRGSANQLGDAQSSSHEGSGRDSPVYWTQDTSAMNTSLTGDFMSSRLQTGSGDSLKYNSMVRSMFDGSADRYHMNGSSDTVKPNGSAMYTWQQSPECDLTAPESMSPRPVHTSTN